MRASRFASTLAVLACASCGAVEAPPELGPRRGSRVEEVLRLRFRRSIIPVLEQAFRPTERSTPELDPHGGRVFVGTTDAHLYCLRAEDGATLWRFETHAAIEGEPLYERDADVVYVASGDGAVYAIAAGDGREIWNHEIRLLAQRKPVATADALYVSAGGTSVFAIARRDGERLWAYRRDSPEGFTVEGQAGVATHERHLYTGFSDGVVVALSAIDGTVEWERDTSVDVEEVEGALGAPRYLDVDTTPVVMGQRVFAASYGGGVYALQASGGGVVWRREDLRQVTGLAGRQGTLYAAVTGRGIVALDAATGQSLWTAAVPGGGLSSPVLLGRWGLVTSHQRGLYVVSLGDGSVVQSIEPGRGVFGAPAVRGRRAFFLSNSAVLYALDVQG